MLRSSMWYNKDPTYACLRCIPRAAVLFLQDRVTFRALVATVLGESASHFIPPTTSESRKDLHLIFQKEPYRTASQGNRQCHCPGLVGALPTGPGGDTPGGPACRGHCQISILSGQWVKGGIKW